MDIKGTLVVEREETATFDLAKLTDHWTDEEKAALADPDHDDHDEARDALLDNASDGLTRPLWTERSSFIRKLKIK